MRPRSSSDKTRTLGANVSVIFTSVNADLSCLARRLRGGRARGGRARELELWGVPPERRRRVAARPEQQGALAGVEVLGSSAPRAQGRILQRTAVREADRPRMR